jgi:hypothetical protein
LTPTPTPTPGTGTAQTVTFDDLAEPGRPLDGLYPSGLIDWGSGQWYLSPPWGSFLTNSVSFTSGRRSASFALLSPRRLTSLDVFNGGNAPTGVLVACPGQLTRQISLAANQLATMTLNWTGPCSNITVSSSNGFEANFDTLVFDEASAPSATPSPISNPTLRARHV